MAKSTRPFRKLEGTSKQNDEFCVLHNRRPYVFSFATADGGGIVSQGNVRPEDTEELVEIFKKLRELHLRGNEGKD